MVRKSEGEAKLRKEQKTHLSQFESYVHHSKESGLTVQIINICNQSEEVLLKNTHKFRTKIKVNGVGKCSRKDIQDSFYFSVYAVSFFFYN